MPAPSDRTLGSYPSLVVGFSLIGAFAFSATGVLCFSLMLHLAFVGFGAPLWIDRVILGVNAIAGVGLIVYLLPVCVRALGIRARHLYPPDYREWLHMPSISHQLILLRGLLVGVITTLVGILIAAEMLQRLEVVTTASRIGEEHPSLLWAMAVLMVLVGTWVWRNGAKLYQKHRSSHIHSSLRYYHRGVALRSFISAWDSPSRPIYDSCRLSRRLSTAHRSFYFITVSCYGFAACCLALIASPSYFSEGACAAIVVLMLATWPTSERLVKWSGAVLDPFCGNEDTDEFV